MNPGISKLASRKAMRVATVGSDQDSSGKVGCSMASSVKSVALKATAVAAAALGAAQFATPAAKASAIGGIFLYSTNAGVNGNCGGGTHYIANKGNVNLGYYDIYNAQYLYTSYNGYFQTSVYEDLAATEANKQEWCVGADFRYRYYAANAFHRYISYYLYCTSIGCAYLGDHTDGWISGV